MKNADYYKDKQERNNLIPDVDPLQKAAPVRVLFGKKRLFCNTGDSEKRFV
jgi:hypothetical protein